MKHFKKNKQLEILQKEGIPLTTQPSKVLILKNGGIMNGFTRASLYEIFNSSVKDSVVPVEIEMPATKVFSILKFRNVGDSLKFMEVYDGFSAPSDSREPRKTFYCFFTNEEWSIPEEKSGYYFPPIIYIRKKNHSLSFLNVKSANSTIGKIERSNVSYLVFKNKI